ncbi:MAG: hemolysin family protein [Clostridia bacterium]|nr:hemolysin family protein [Clostridia bacterium]
METRYIIELIALVIFIVALVILKKNVFSGKKNIEEDVMSILEEGQESGAIKEEGKKMINSIFAFDDEVAYEIMTPRTDVFMIDINDPAEEYIDQLMELRHTRIPVYDDDPDNIIGILNIKDYLIQARKQGFDNIEIGPILRDAYFVPDSKNIDTLFFEMQKARQQIAILIDEYGGFSGIVTLEDIIEEVMGDIDDEYDEAEELIRKIGNNQYIIDGNASLTDINEELEINLESESSETLSGFLIDIIGDLPEEGEKSTVEYQNYQFLIIEVKERRIEKVKMTVLSGEESA